MEMQVARHVADIVLDAMALRNCSAMPTPGESVVPVSESVRPRIVPISAGEEPSAYGLVHGVGAGHLTVGFVVASFPAERRQFVDP